MVFFLERFHYTCMHIMCVCVLVGLSEHSRNLDACDINKVIIADVTAVATVFSHAYRHVRMTTCTLTACTQTVTRMIVHTS